MKGEEYMNRLTKIYPGGAVTLDAAAFPDRTQETLNREISAFPPFRKVVQRLAEYEASGLEPEEAMRLAENHRRARSQSFVEVFGY